MKQLEPIATPRNLRDFYYNYELPLAKAFHQIERRGVQTDAVKLEELRNYLLVALEEVAEGLSNEAHKHVAFSKKHADRVGWERKDYINLSYPGDVAKLLESRGLRLPTNRTTGRKSTAEDALNQLYADTGDEITMRILHAREYTKILGTYVNVKLHNGTLYSTYRVTGTVNGRRSASKNIFGYGTNHQNIPKHSELGCRYRECIVARPGEILINCDEVQAEDWIVVGIIADIGGDYTGLDELSSGTDRHSNLASKLFSKPVSECGKNTHERFMGKKTRHAGNYDVGPDEFARQLVKEGFTNMPPGLCAWLLSVFHRENPGIRDVYHKYIKDQLSRSRILVSPLGRERVFLGCRPFADNGRVFKEAFSFLPQATVGDNTGLAVLFCELNHPGLVVMEAHDSITLEVNDNLSDIHTGCELLAAGYHRTIRFPNGLEIEIPIEFEIGYSLGTMLSLRDASETSIQDAHRRCQADRDSTGAKFATAG